VRSIQARADRAEPPATQPTSDKSPQVSPTKHSALSSHLQWTAVLSGGHAC